MSNSLGPWDPLREFSDLQNRMSNLFFRNTGEGALADSAERSDWAPAVDIAEDDDAFTVTADLPDVSRDDVKVSVDNGVMTLSGERRHESEDEDNKKKFHRIERSYGRYVRTFRLPGGVDADKVKARFKEGVLTITVPKTEETKPEQKEIKVD